MNNQANSQKILSIQIIHASMTLGVAIFLAVIYFSSMNSVPVKAEDPSAAEFNLTLSYAAAALCVLGIFTGNLLFNLNLMKSGKMTSHAVNPDELSQDSIAAFITAHIIRIAMLEGPALLACANLFLITASAGILDYDLPAVQFSLATVAIFFVMMIYLFPNQDKITSSMQKLKKL